MFDKSRGLLDSTSGTFNDKSNNTNNYKSNTSTYTDINSNKYDVANCAKDLFNTNNGYTENKLSMPTEIKSNLLNLEKEKFNSKLLKSKGLIKEENNVLKYNSNKKNNAYINERFTSLYIKYLYEFNNKIINNKKDNINNNNNNILPQNKENDYVIYKVKKNKNETIADKKIIKENNNIFKNTSFLNKDFVSNYVIIYHFIYTLYIRREYIVFF